MRQWRPIHRTDRGLKGHWFFMCPTCPAHGDKILHSDSAEPIACMTGLVATNGNLHVSAICWHTTRTSVRQGRGLSINKLEVHCSFNPNTDHWNHPGGLVGEPKQDAVMATFRDETVPEMIGRLRSGALFGTIQPRYSLWQKFKRWAKRER